MSRVFTNKGSVRDGVDDVDQWFLTGVPWTSYKCSAKILKSVKKKNSKFFQNRIILGFVGLFLYTKTLSLTFE